MIHEKKNGQKFQKMKHLNTIFYTSLLILFFHLSYGQKPEVIIRLEEDYSNPNGRHHENSSKYVERKIEDGIYKSQSITTAVNAELTFGLRIEQRNCFFENDAEFEILKTGKNKPTDFIGIKFIIREVTQKTDTSSDNSNSFDFDLEHYLFYYNNEGKWKLLKGNLQEEVQSGTSAINPDKNILKVEHLPNQTNLYLNGTKACEIKTSRLAKLEWKDIVVTAESNKTKIGLDKAIFTGYFFKKNPPLLAEDVYGLNVFSFEYNDGLAVKMFADNKYKYMDNWGRIKGNAEFDEVYTLQSKSPMIWAKNEGLYGYINFDGNWAVQPIYTEASKSECFEKDACLPGYFKVKNAEGKEFLVNNKGNIVSLKNGKIESSISGNNATVKSEAPNPKSNADISKFVEQVKDNDGNNYDAVKIGSRVWASQNLKVKHFLNGDVIPEAKTDEEWKLAGISGKPAWCYAKYDSGEILYNWYTVNDKRGLAPKGWHIPSSADWQMILKPIGPLDKKEAGYMLKAKSGWDSDGIGSDEYGFNALPIKSRSHNGSFDIFTTSLHYWTSTKEFILILNSYKDLEIKQFEYSNGLGTGYSVRMVKD